jgi:1-phosphofructokinase family hexose kinase
MIYTVTLNPGVDHTLTVAVLDFNQVLRASQVQRDCGGKGFNVSRSLKLLGVDSTALGFIGGDNGRWEERQLQAFGIPTDFDLIEGDTRTCVVIIESGTGKHVKVNEPGPIITAAEMKRFARHVESSAMPGDYWAFCGSLPPGIPPDYYAQLIRAVQSQGAKACLDASQEAFRLGITAKPFLVKPNREEAEGLTGFPIRSEADCRNAAKLFLAEGIQYVALSLGAEGLFFCSAQESILVKPPIVVFRSPVGPGDALLGGLIYALNRGLPFPDIARWGVACGTTAVSLAGTNFGAISDVLALLRQL